MDILGMGTSIVECSRIREMIERHGERFLQRVYTPAEIRWCQSRRDASEQFAATWATKEAAFKALNLKPGNQAGWALVEVDHRSHPNRVLLRGDLAEHFSQEGREVLITSMAYSRQFATSTVLVIRKEVRY